ncbi:unnamed protein product [Mytilus coruscus]|uniref:Uncharacterized protein n=1 Tax=Mytilus coruscus TaxID=42192 RepID=A0A6J8ESL3_MYTCO|nr:unnamed protein product [Mytilus coruscus]
MSEKSFEDVYESLKDKSNTYVPFEDDLNDHGNEYQFLSDDDREMENDYTRQTDDENGSDFEIALPSGELNETCELSESQFNSESHRERRKETNAEDGDHCLLQKTNNHIIDQRLGFITTFEIERINIPQPSSNIELKYFHLDFDVSVLQQGYLALDVRGATPFVWNQGQRECITKHFQGDLQEYFLTSSPSDQKLRLSFTALHLIAKETTFELPNMNIDVKTKELCVVNNCPIVPRRYFAKQHIFQVRVALQSKEVNGMKTLYLRDWKVLCQQNRVSRVMFQIEISKEDINALLTFHDMLTHASMHYNSVLELEINKPIRRRQLRRDDSKRFNCIVARFEQHTGEKMFVHLHETVFRNFFRSETSAMVCFIHFSVKNAQITVTESNIASNVINTIFKYPGMLQDAFNGSMGFPVNRNNDKLGGLPKTLKTPAFSLNQFVVKICEKLNINSSFEMSLESSNFDKDRIRSKASDFGDGLQSNSSNQNMSLLHKNTTQKQDFGVEQILKKRKGSTNFPKIIRMVQTSVISEDKGRHQNISDFPTQKTEEMTGYKTVATQYELLNPQKDERKISKCISDYSKRVKEIKCTKLSERKEPRFSLVNSNFMQDLPNAVLCSQEEADKKTVLQSYYPDHASKVDSSSTSLEKPENKRRKETGVIDHAIRYCTQAYEYSDDSNRNGDDIADGAGVICIGIADRSIKQISDAADHSEGIVNIHDRTMTIAHPSSDQDETWSICPSTAKHTATHYDNRIPFRKHDLKVPSEGARNEQINLFNTCCFDGFLVMVFIVLQFDPVLRGQFETTSNEMHQIFYKIWRHYERGEFDKGKILWCKYGDMIPVGAADINLVGDERVRIFSTFNKNRILTEIWCSEKDCLGIIERKEKHGILIIWETGGKPLVESIEREINSYLMKSLGDCGSIQRNGEKCRGSRIRQIKDPPYFLPINLYHLRLLKETYSSEDLPETVRFNEHVYKLKLVKLYKDSHFVEKLKVINDWTYYDNKEAKLCYFDRDPESSLLSSCFYVRKTLQI